MNPFAWGVVAVVVAAVATWGILLFVRSRSADEGPDEFWESLSAVHYECDPETCAHEWVVERTEDVEMTIDYCSYGGPDPVGIVTYTYLYCPKCGARDVEESAPVPL